MAKLKPLFTKARPPHSCHWEAIASGSTALQQHPVGRYDGLDLGHPSQPLRDIHAALGCGSLLKQVSTSPPSSASSSGCETPPIRRCSQGCRCSVGMVRGCAAAEGGGRERALGSGGARREDGSCGAGVSLRWASSPFPPPQRRRAAQSHHPPTGVLVG